MGNCLGKTWCGSKRSSSKKGRKYLNFTNEEAASPYVSKKEVDTEVDLPDMAANGAHTESDEDQDDQGLEEVSLDTDNSKLESISLSKNAAPMSKSAPSRNLLIDTARGKVGITSTIELPAQKPSVFAPTQKKVEVLGPNALVTNHGPTVLFKSPKPIPKRIPYRRKLKLTRSDLKFKREKNNSTSSLYIKDTIIKPNNEELIRCESTQHVSYDVFNENKHPLSYGKIDFTQMPSINTVYSFMRVIFKVQRLASECAVLCLAYIERLIAYTGITLYPCNWRRVTLGALLIACKVWEEDAVWNADFLDLFPSLMIADLNTLELYWLDSIQFNVTVTASQYAKYYFELRALSEVDATHFPLEPLDKETAQALEKKSGAREKAARSFDKSKSMDHYVGHSRAVIQ